MTENTEVVVIGGGYAGAMAANRLTQRDDMTVTLINPRPSFVHRIRLHQVASGADDPVVGYREILAEGVRLPAPVPAEPADLPRIHRKLEGAWGAWPCRQSASPGGSSGSGSGCRTAFFRAISTSYRLWPVAWAWAVIASCTFSAVPTVSASACCSAQAARSSSINSFVSSIATIGSYGPWSAPVASRGRRRTPASGVRGPYG